MIAASLLKLKSSVKSNEPAPVPKSSCRYQIVFALLKVVTRIDPNGGSWFPVFRFFLTARSAVLPAPEHHQCCCGAGGCSSPPKQWSDQGLDPSPHQTWALDASKVLVIIEQWIEIVYEHCSKLYGVILTINNQYILDIFGLSQSMNIWTPILNHLSCRYPTTGWCPASMARSNGVVLPLEVLENLQPKFKWTT